MIRTSYIKISQYSGGFSFNFVLCEVDDRAKFRSNDLLIFHNPKSDRSSAVFADFCSLRSLSFALVTILKRIGRILNPSYIML